MRHLFRRVDVVAAVIGVLLLGGDLVRAIATHSGFVAEHPQNLAWIALSIAIGSATFLANGSVAPSRAVISLTGHGAVAMLLAFVLQRAVNGTLLSLASPPQHGTLLYVGLGIGAAVCQTAAKWLTLAATWRLRRASRGANVVAMGLAIGLGFGASEAIFIGARLIDSETGVSGIGAIGIWERAVSIAFHTYTTGLIATAVALRQRWPVLAVLGAHSFNDGLAGMTASGVVALSVPALESIFTGVAVSLWLLFRRVAARVRVAGADHATVAA